MTYSHLIGPHHWNSWAVLLALPASPHPPAPFWNSGWLSWYLSHRFLCSILLLQDPQQRVANILDSITTGLYSFTSRGMFEQHKLIFSTMITLAILSARGDIQPDHCQFLLHGPRKYGTKRPDTVVDWLPEANWASVMALAEVDGNVPAFEMLPDDLAEGKRWREWCDLEKPEDEKLPMHWKDTGVHSGPGLGCLIRWGEQRGLQATTRLLPVLAITPSQRFGLYSTLAIFCIDTWLSQIQNLSPNPPVVARGVGPKSGGAHANLHHFEPKNSRIFFFG